MGRVEASGQISPDSWKNAFIKEVRCSGGYKVLDPIHNDCETFLRVDPENTSALQILAPDGGEGPRWYSIGIEDAIKNRLKWLTKLNPPEIRG